MERPDFGSIFIEMLSYNLLRDLFWYASAHIAYNTNAKQNHMEVHFISLLPVYMMMVGYDWIYLCLSCCFSSYWYVGVAGIERTQKVVQGA